MRYITSLILVLMLTKSTWAYETITLGKTFIKISKNSTIGTQIDRVFRDLAWKNSPFEYGKIQLSESPKIDEIVPYMEGKLTRMIMQYTNASVIGLTPAIAIKRNNQFYALDESDNFQYRIDPSKTLYKTAIINNGYGWFPDTHGFNMIANQAIKVNSTQPLSLVIACMDLPSKAKAALALAKQGINCYGPCDRFAYQLLGHDTPGTIIGTAPLRQTKDGAIIGNQPIVIHINEEIIIQYTTKLYPNQYCDTASRYFTALAKKYNLPLKLTRIYANVGETKKLVDAAKKKKAHVIGVRIFNKEDAEPIRNWLKSDPKNRAVLFHTAIYNVEFFDEFPTQTTFGDLKPIIK